MQHIFIVRKMNDLQKIKTNLTLKLLFLREINLDDFCTSTLLQK